MKAELAKILDYLGSRAALPKGVRRNGRAAQPALNGHGTANGHAAEL
jgi:hypothetical protein